MILVVNMLGCGRTKEAQAQTTAKKAAAEAQAFPL